jgi:phage N-6-adenine-methyltransferase
MTDQASALSVITDRKPSHAPGALTRYDAARAALAAAHRVDEVKHVRDIAVAMAAYAQQANDVDMLKQATEIKLRAERRWGALYAESEKAKGAKGNPGGRGAPIIVQSPTDDRTSPTLAAMHVTKTQSVKFQKLAKLPEEKFEIRVEHAIERVAAMTTSAPGLSRNGYIGENEWFTPPEWIERARTVLGEIDLDPASHVIAQETVRASKFYTIADDGLAQQWAGRVWMNPPYARAMLQPFVDKLLAAYAAGDVSAALILVHAYTDVSWFHSAARAAAAVCFPRRRIQFIAPSGEKCAQMNSQAFFYFGRDERAFVRTFRPVGVIMRAAAIEEEAGR